MPCRAAERSNSMAFLPSRGAPLPSRSSKARLCLATATLPSAAFWYHSTALVESRSTTKPRSYITPTLNAAAGEPASARAQQPAGAGLRILRHPDARRPAGAPAPPSRATSPPWAKRAGRRSAGPSIRRCWSAWRRSGPAVAMAQARPQAAAARRRRGQPRSRSSRPARRVGRCRAAAASGRCRRRPVAAAAARTRRASRSR